MAIKGKGRTRSGRRVVATPPRPALVVRKPPFWRRSWFLITAVVILVLVAAGLTYNLLHSRAQKSLRSKETAAVKTLSQRLVATFPNDTKQVPPDLFAFYSALSQDLDNLNSGKLSAADVITKADTVISTAQKTQQEIQNLSVATLIPKDFTVTTVQGSQARALTQEQLLDAQFLMSQAFGLYQEAGQIMKEAVGASGRERAALVSQAKSLFNQAGSTFDRGFQTLLRIRAALGIALSFGTSGAGAGPNG